MNQPPPLFCIQSGSDDVDTHDAMVEILEDAKQQLANSAFSTPKGALVFFDVEHDADVILESLYHHWPNLQVAGCSSYGEFNLNNGMQDGSIQIIFFCGDIELYVRSFDDVSHNNLESNCRSLLDIAHTPTVSILLFDVIQFDSFDTTLSILKEQTPEDHIIIGGGASDDYDFHAIKMISNRDVLQTGCVMMHLCGDITASTSSSLGWRSHGDKGTVTRSSFNALIEVDNHSALNFYYDQTGGVTPYQQLPLSVFSPEGEFIFNRANTGEVILPEQTKAVKLYGFIPEGCQIQVSSTDKDTLLGAISDDLKKTQQYFSEKRPIALALFFSCVSRRAFLSTEVNKESEIIKKHLPHGVPGMGCYTLGEVGKLSSNSPVNHHNNSLVYVLIG